MEFCLPELGEGIIEAELVQWMVAPGDKVVRGQDIAEVMTDKAAVELPSPFTGTIDQLLVEPGQQINVGDSMLHYETADDGAVPTTSLETVSESTLANKTGPSLRRPISTGHSPSAVAAPSVRRMARQLGIDLSTVRGSGPNGRVLIDDLATAVNRTEISAAPLEGQSKECRSEKPASKKPVPGTRTPIRGLRRTIAQRMTHAVQTIPHFSYIDEVDVTDLVRMRESLKEPFAKKGINLTYLSFFAKATIAALQEVPQVNASIDTEAGEIVLHDHYHIGIATDTPRGLTVPVLRDVDQKDLPQIASEIVQLTNAARAGKATADQLQGNTFTITSTGGIGGLISTPIINEPAVGILGIGKVVKRPRYDDAGKIFAADVVYLSLSFDHRVVDGADAARFANSLIARLNNPASLLLDIMGAFRNPSLHS